MNIPCDSLVKIREKSGVSVYRVHSGSHSYVLKYFQNDSDRREITNYHILSGLGIQTIPLMTHTERAILMEDMQNSVQYRLGILEDLNDCAVAGSLAQWYRTLHEAGYSYVEAHGSTMYDETDVITPDNISRAALRTKTQDAPVWKLVLNHFEEVMAAVRKPKRTLTYNDFYYTNLIAARDKSEAFMFDYNLLGKGYAFSDIRNVTSSMGKRQRQSLYNPMAYITKRNT